MMFLLRFYPYIAGMAVLLSLTAWVYHRGYSQCQSNNASAIINAEKERSIIERKIMPLDDYELEKRISKWYRD